MGEDAVMAGHACRAPLLSGTAGSWQLAEVQMAALQL